jgi:hypothetical protein
LSSFRKSGTLSVKESTTFGVSRNLRAESIDGIGQIALSPCIAYPGSMLQTQCIERNLKPLRFVGWIEQAYRHSPVFERFGEDKPPGVLGDDFRLPAERVL